MPHKPDPASPSSSSRLDPRPGGGGGYKKRTEENKAAGDNWAECLSDRYPVIKKRISEEWRWSEIT